MKDVSLLIVVCFVMLVKVQGQQCSGSVPLNAIIVGDTISTQINQEHHWICSGGLLIKNGNEGSAVVEKGGQVSINGNEVILYLRSGAIGDVNGNKNIIYVDRASTLLLAGNENIVRSVEGAAIADNGNENVFEACEALIINYDSVPAMGCMVDMGPPMVSFETAAITVNEGDREVTAGVLLTNANDAVTRVAVVVSGGTAVQGDDYLFQDTTLEFPALSSVSMDVHLTLKDDLAVEANETVELTLQNATNGAEIGQAVLTIVITDNDQDTGNDSCRASVPNTAIVVSDIRTETSSEAAYWLCSGSNLTLSGGNSTLFVESGGIATITGSEDTVFVQSNGSTTITGNDNLVYVANGGIAVVTGNNNTIYAMAGAVTTVSGLDNTSLTCAELLIDYTMAPDAGCAITDITHRSIAADLTLAPNPASHQLHFSSVLLSWTKTQVLDGYGRILWSNTHRRASSTESLDLTSFPVGIYYLQLTTDQGWISKRFTIVR